MTIMERAQAPDFWSWRESILCYHIYARRLLNLFMEMNCVRETFIRLSGLTVIVDSVSVSVSLDDTVPADGLVNLFEFAKRAPRRSDEWETGAPLTAPRTLVVCEP
jgi:hypothetical protein